MLVNLIVAIGIVAGLILLVLLIGGLLLIIQGIVQALIIRHRQYSRGLLYLSRDTKEETESHE